MGRQCSLGSSRDTVTIALVITVFAGGSSMICETFRGSCIRLDPLQSRSNIGSLLKTIRSVSGVSLRKHLGFIVFVIRRKQ